MKKIKTLLIGRNVNYWGGGSRVGSGFKMLPNKTGVGEQRVQFDR